MAAQRQVTARTDYQLREAPYVALDSVYASGYACNVRCLFDPDRGWYEGRAPCGLHAFSRWHCRVWTQMSV